MTTSHQILDIAARHVGEQYVWGTFVAKDNPNWHGPWDCAEFMSWCVYQAAGTLHGCSDHARPSQADAYTGYWKRDGKELGRRITVDVGGGR